jgi:hypothetical protein
MTGLTPNLTADYVMTPEHDPLDLPECLADIPILTVNAMRKKEEA